MQTRSEIDNSLTPRETQVLDLMSLGFATKVIAKNLRVSEKRVEQLRRSIREKFQTSSNAQVVDYARARHLLIPERENVRITQEHWEAIGAHEPKEFAATLASECIWESDALSRSVRGRGSARDAIHVYFDAFPDLVMETESIVCRGDHGTVYWQAAGTHQGEFFGISPSQQLGKVRGCTQLQFERGRIIYMRDYWDVNALLEQMGIVRLQRHGHA